MAILGADPERYQEYCQQIRQEFKQVDTAVFRQGRLYFIKSLLGKEKIFLTVKFQKIYGNQAVINLEEEQRILERR